MPGAGRPFLWDARCPAPRATYPDGGIGTPVLKRAASVDRAAGRPYSVLLPVGFTLPPVTGGAVRSYRTVSPLPRPGCNARAGRFVFCGTVPGVAPAGR